MKKRVLFLIIIAVLVLCSFLLICLSKASVIINPSPENFKNQFLDNLGIFQDENKDSATFNRELLCNCIGLNLKGAGESNKENIYCYGIRFNCVERCNVYLLKQNQEQVNIISVPCDCGKTCMYDLMNITEIEADGSLEFVNEIPYP